LVFATLHTNSAVDSVERIVGSFSADRQAQIRTVLSSTLQAVLAQQLLRHISGHGRVLAAECMVVTPAIRNLIREGKTPMMMSAMLSSAKEGSLTMDNCLINLVAERKISPQMAYDSCADKEYIKKKLMLP
jgi:twitching motility protein PilT